MKAEKFKRLVKKDLGLSYKDVALMFGLNERTVRRYAKGEAKVPHALAITLRLLNNSVIDTDDVKYFAQD